MKRFDQRRRLLAAIGLAKPADMPIEQPNIYDLVINLRTAKALGLPISTDLRLRASRVIE